MAEQEGTLPITIEFAGGAELLFDKIKKREVILPPINTYLSSTSPSNRWTITHLLRWMEKNLLRERPELFLQQESVRPGILVLVNQEDWELCGAGDYQLQPRDSILFISTLHGG